MKTLCLSVFLMATFYCQAQSIVGRWQLVKQSSCVEDELGEEDDPETQELINTMKGMSDKTPQVIEFKDNNSGSESTKIISRKKSYNSRSFLYRLSDNSIYFLDKKSRTIIEGFTIERLEADSLIISNTSQACETKVFVRIR